MKHLFDNLYASVFIIVLLAVIGGGSCAWLAASGRFNWELQQSSVYYSRYGRFDGLFFRCFGIEDWRIQFAIGATAGVACAAVWLWRYWRPTTDPPFANDSVAADGEENPNTQLEM